ncbi:hypothetical protein CLG96_05375 [Sphingomonas oleivorans]|uniref:DUF3616 domain-containing protein n=1 Tax=Sphingomonas oleivorans TaxID=1735121 RepID=A0A2T5FZ86_9SPHN|nr:DUF3616 domain-containing protein [Sphingomonas oleivorans]PTQ12012.1 hypothetical protein CLG96_05375 [Sphingomonas oleivorans]
MSEASWPSAPSAHPWREVTPACGRVEIALDADLEGADDPLADLSAAVRVGDTLFLGSDEGAAIERLERDGTRWVRHRRLMLADYLDLDPAAEADVEGLAEEDGWLWVLGSHARTRPKLRRRGEDRIDLGTFSNLNDTRARCLLARLPLVPDPHAPGRVMPVLSAGGRRAGMLERTKYGNELARLLARHPLLKPFTQIPAKEGGIDLEGIAVAGSRLAIGMRGPVIRNYAVLLEMEIGARRSGALRIDGPLFKRLLDLEGLGIRDLKRIGADLLILAGPTTGLDGPCAIYRWRDWLSEPAEHYDMVRLHRPERIIDLPFGRGDDHPEGLALIDRADGRLDLLIVCDGPAPFRLDAARRRLACDLFRLPD